MYMVRTIIAVMFHGLQQNGVSSRDSLLTLVDDDDLDDDKPWFVEEDNVEEEEEHMKSPWDWSELCLAVQLHLFLDKDWWANFS